MKKILCLIFVSTLTYCGQNTSSQQTQRTYRFVVPEKIRPLQIAILRNFHMEPRSALERPDYYRVTSMRDVEIENIVFTEVMFEKLPNKRFYYLQNRREIEISNLIGTEMEAKELVLELKIAKQM